MLDASNPTFELSWKFLTITFVSLFTTINPVGATSFFLSHPAIALGAAERRAIARKASFTCFLVLTAFALFGEVLFQLMGVTMVSFTIAGGIFVFTIALEMMRGANVRARTLPEEQQEALHKEDISIIPLAIPLLAGPGSMTTVVVLMSRTHNFGEGVTVIALIMLVSILTYLVLDHAPHLLKRLGPTGVRVMNRILGLVLGAIAVQFIINGVKQLKL